MAHNFSNLNAATAKTDEQKALIVFCGDYAKHILDGHDNKTAYKKAMASAEMIGCTSLVETLQKYIVRDKTMHRGQWVNFRIFWNVRDKYPTVA